MIKKKLMIIVALVTVSILVGTLFYSKIVSGASSSSGSWGIIRFYTANETSSFGGWVVAATFTWVPENATNNHIMSVSLVAEFKTTADYLNDFRIQIKSWNSEIISDGYGNNVWKWTRYEFTPEGFNEITNQAEYTIKLLIKGGNPDNTVAISARNVSVFLTVADGILPNEYYKVELPSEGVGGYTIPVDKLGLLAPYIASVSTIILAVSIAVTIIKHRKKQ